MPGSTISASNSSASSASRRAKTRQYRTVSHHSQVDESLFGDRNQNNQKNCAPLDNPQEVNIQKQARDRNRKKRTPYQNKETVQIITKDLIRNLIVPTDDPSGKSIILDPGEFSRILGSSHVLTREEKLARWEAMKREKEQLVDDALERKRFIKSMDLARQKHERLTDLELEAKDKAEHLLANANAMRQEQEDEIKYLNELILNAKCHAIRDAQILEKGQIKREMTEEERRLDKMMEVDRQNAIVVQEEIERRRRDDKLFGAGKLLEQIEENEQSRLFELEKKDQENVQMQKYIEKLMEEDIADLDKKKRDQVELREELNKANDAIMRRRELVKEQEMLAEMKVLEFQKEKAEREAVYEAEQERIRIQKEKEVAHLRSLQERAQDKQAERDAIRARRAQEETEREWRLKEAAQQEKKAAVEAMLKEARTVQLQHKEHNLAVQAQRERAEFERVLRAQNELMEKEKREEETAACKRHHHADEVRAQIRQRERERILERNEFFEEGVRLDEEARLRRQKLDEVKSKKLQELRAAGIPEKYLSQVERKVNQPQKIMV
ncbi:cilia- and flagella-associated protein 45-like [Gigantopelta aegis]|uniref:cilia- and flagella-associated protein 45-like n=1 Tax=Gigantopelta aegis TaxID=1735272 RepID=UPI001B88BEF9|nr:cilia- and flagella-associated protein 45-like [Gigantopelta aegis]